MEKLSTSKFELFLLHESTSICLAVHQIPTWMLSLAFVYHEANGSTGISLRPTVPSIHCSFLITFLYLLLQRKNLPPQILPFFQGSTLMITSSLPQIPLHPGLHFILTV